MTRRIRGLVLLAVLALAPSASAAGIHAVGSIAPRPMRFGDVIHATIVVHASAQATVQPGFSPFAVVGSGSSSSSSGGETVSTFRFDLQCLDVQCAPGKLGRTVSLTPSRVRAGGTTVSVRVPSVRVLPRVTPSEVLRPVHSFRHPTTPPKPGYRIAPGTARGILVAAAAVLVLLAAALLWPVLRPRRAGAATGARGDALARALAFVRAARTRPAADRRRALALLARTLRERDDQHDAGDAGALAWSEPEPDPAQMTGLADRVEERT